MDGEGLVWPRGGRKTTRFVVAIIPEEVFSAPFESAMRYANAYF
jgi:hypothetical protein